MSRPKTITITISLPKIAKQIDHALLHPTMIDTEILTGLNLCKHHNVAAACVKPYSVPTASTILAETSVAVCAVIGFPHGNSTTTIKVAEATACIQDGATEIDMVINIGRFLGGDHQYVTQEIKAVNDAVVAGGAILKVIFENDYLQPPQIEKLCEMCTEIGVAFVKTSTGFGFVKQGNGMYEYKGATVSHVKLMREVCGSDGPKVKAAGGVKTLDEFLYMMHLGVERIGTSGTVGILEEARRRGITDEPTVMEINEPCDGEKSGGSGY